MSEFESFIDSIRSGDLNKVKQLFKEEYIDKRSRGRNALHWASGENNGDIIRYLLSEGFNIEDETTTAFIWGRVRSIHIAARHGHTDTLTELIEGNCSLDCVDEIGQTPLDIAIKWKSVECQQLLEDAMKPVLDVYEKKDYLGHGTYGSVFKCLDTRDNTIFAMKEVQIKSYGHTVNSLENEIKLYEKIPIHPNIVRYYGTTKDKNNIRIILEYMDEGSLRDKLDKEKTFNIKKIAFYSKQILEGIKFLHQQNIIHRDIKASNILISLNGAVKLCDFGTSRFLCTLIGTSCDKHSKREMAKTFCGTPHFIAPEVICDEPYTFSADVWSFGAVVVEMLTGEPPNSENTREQAMYKVGMTKKADYKSPQQEPQELKLFLKSIFVSDTNKRADVKALLNSSFIIKFYSPDERANRKKS